MKPKYSHSGRYISVKCNRYVPWNMWKINLQYNVIERDWTSRKKSLRSHVTERKININKKHKHLFDYSIFECAFRCVIFVFNSSSVHSLFMYAQSFKNIHIDSSLENDEAKSFENFSKRDDRLQSEIEKNHSFVRQYGGVALFWMKTIISLKILSLVRQGWVFAVQFDSRHADFIFH